MSEEKHQNGLLSHLKDDVRSAPAVVSVAAHDNHHHHHLSQVGAVTASASSSHEERKAKNDFGEYYWRSLESEIKATLLCFP